MAQLPRRRLNSLSDNSTPSSDISEGSEDCRSSTNEWNYESQNAHSLIVDNLDLRLDSLSLENSSVSEISDNERAQIESFFSGLGTEVSTQQNYFSRKHYNDGLFTIFMPLLFNQSF